MADEVPITRRSRPDKLAPPAKPALTYAPEVDVIETPQALVVLADVPGVSKDTLEVVLEQGVLTLKGEVESAGEPGLRLDAQEYEGEGFYRSFTVGPGFDAARVEATVKDGVVRIVIPKSPEHAARRIEVKEG
jgi:HSP20 family protein